MDYLDRSDPRQAEPDERLVPQPQVGAVPIGADQLLERLRVAEPSSRAHTLDLPVQARDLAKRVVPAHQRLHEGGVGLALTNAPPHQSARPGERIANCVVRSPLPTPRQHDRLSQQPRMVNPGEDEQSLQVPLVLPPGAGAGIPQGELRDKGLPRGRPYVNTS